MPHLETAETGFYFILILFFLFFYMMKLGVYPAKGPAPLYLAPELGLDEGAMTAGSKTFSDRRVNPARERVHHPTTSPINKHHA
jgi:hypothetical protein